MKPLISIALIGVLFMSPKTEGLKGKTNTNFESGMCKTNRLFFSTTGLAGFATLNVAPKINDQYVTFYKDENFGGPSDSYIVGTRVECLPDPNPSVWGLFVHTCNVYNDQITSIKVPAGLKVTCFIDCGFQGTPSARVFTEDCSNVGPDWNDKISSFIIDYN